MENHFNCIYMYVNKVNGKRYVGKAKDFIERHKRHLKGKLLIDKKLREYGEENFEIIILEENVETDSQLGQLEDFYITKYDTYCKNGKGYNIAEGGHGGDTLKGMTDEQRQEIKDKQSKAFSGEKNPMYGKKHSKEAKVKQAKAKKGKKLSKETKQKISELKKGYKHSEEWKKQHSEKLKGHKHSEETKMKMSKEKKDKYNGSANPNAHSIICLETLEIFGCIKEAQVWLGKGNISANLIGQSKSAGKHPITGEKLHWMYYDEYLEQQNKNNSDSNNNKVA